MKYHYKIKGLDCANCAAKLETALKKIHGVKNLTINFMAQSIIFETDDSISQSEIKESLLNITKKIESDVKYYSNENELIVIEHHTKEKCENLLCSHCAKCDNQINKSSHNFNMFQLISIVFSAILFAIGLFLPEEGYYKFAIYLIAYLIAGWKILFEAVKNIFHGKIFDENFLMSIASIGAFILGEYPEGAAVMILYQTG